MVELHLIIQTNIFKFDKTEDNNNNNVNLYLYLVYVKRTLSNFKICL